MSHINYYSSCDFICNYALFINTIFQFHNLIISNICFPFFCSHYILLKILTVLLRQRYKILQQKNMNFMQNILTKQVTWLSYFTLSVSHKLNLNTFLESIVSIYFSPQFALFLISFNRPSVAPLLWTGRSSSSSYSTYVASKWSRSHPQSNLRPRVLVS